jgi:hypothetical protein
MVGHVLNRHQTRKLQHITGKGLGVGQPRFRKVDVHLPHDLACLAANPRHTHGQPDRIREELEASPRRVPASDLESLKTERKLIADTIKMTAYQVESRLFGLLGEHYSRTEDEGRTLLQAAFQSTARLEVRNDELYVELAPQSSAHRTRAIAALCDQLNTWDTKFPGTHLRLRLGVQPHEPLKNP